LEELFSPSLLAPSFRKGLTNVDNFLLIPSLNYPFDPAE
jgi:hypothetical protein